MTQYLLFTVQGIYIFIHNKMKDLLVEKSTMLDYTYRTDYMKNSFEINHVQCLTMKCNT